MGTRRGSHPLRRVAAAALLALAAVVGWLALEGGVGGEAARGELASRTLPEGVHVASTLPPPVLPLPAAPETTGPAPLLPSAGLAVEVPAAPELLVRVLDDGGGPVRDARVVHASTRERVTTDGTGLARLAFDEGELSASARWHRDGRIALPAVPPDAPLTIVLERQTVLEVLPRGPQRDERGFTITVSAARNFAAGASEAEHPLDLLVASCSGTTLLLGSERSGWEARWFGVESATVVDVEPGLPLRAAVISAAGAPLAEAEVRLQKGEWRRLELEILALPAPLHGRVLDARSAPVAGAEVELRTPEGRGTTTQTDADGRFEQEQVVREATVACLRADGHASVVVETLPPAPAELLVVLPEPDPYELTLLEEGTRRPLEATEVWAERAGFTFELRRLDDRPAWVSDALPRVPVTVKAEVGGHVFSLPREPGQHAGLLLVPVLGSVDVVLERAAPGGELVLPLAIVLTSSQGELRQHLDEHEGWTREGDDAVVSFPGVLPGAWSARAEIALVRGAQFQALYEPADLDVLPGGRQRVLLRTQR